MAETNDQMHSSLQAFIEAAKNNDTVKRKLRMATTAGAIAEAAAEVGITLDPAAVVKYYANQLLNSDDTTAVENFDLCSWDAGELLWIMSNWKTSPGA